MILPFLVAISVIMWAFSIRSEWKNHRFTGAYAWFLLIFGLTVHFGYIANFLKAELPSTGGAELGLRVVTVSMLGVLVGGVLASPKLPARRAFDPSSSIKKFDEDPKRLLMMATVVLSCSWIYFLLLGRVPLFSAWNQGIGALQEARLARDPYINAAQSKIPLSGFWETMRNVGVPALFAATLLHWRHQKRWYHAPLVLVCIVTVLAAGQRWPLQYLLWATLIALISTRAPRIKRHIAQLGITALTAGAVITIAQGRAATGDAGILTQIVAGMNRVAERILFGYVGVPIMSYSLPERFSEPLMGASYFQALSALAPGPGVNYAVTFYNEVLGYNSGYTASPDFATELYLNFRWPGVIFGSLLWAASLRYIDHLFTNRSLTFEGIGLWSITVACLAASATEGLISSSVRPIFVAFPVLLCFSLLPARGQDVQNLSKLKRVTSGGSCSG